MNHGKHLHICQAVQAALNAASMRRAKALAAQPAVVTAPKRKKDKVTKDSHISSTCMQFYLYHVMVLDFFG